MIGDKEVAVNCVKLRQRTEVTSSLSSSLGKQYLLKKVPLAVIILNEIAKTMAWPFKVKEKMTFSVKNMKCRSLNFYS